MTGSCPRNNLFDTQRQGAFALYPAIRNVGVNDRQLTSSLSCIRLTSRSFHSQPVAMCKGCTTRNQQPAKVVLLIQQPMSSKCRSIAGVWEVSGCHAAHKLQNTLWGVSRRASPSALSFKRGERTEPLFIEIRLMHLGLLGPPALPSQTDSSNIGYEQHSPLCTYDRTTGRSDYVLQRLAEQCMQTAIALCAELRYELLGGP